MEWTVAIGVDTHRDRHVAVAVDRLGRTLGSLELAVDERARRQARNQLKAALVPLDPPQRARLSALAPALLNRHPLVRCTPTLAALGRLSKRIQQLESELAEIDAELATLTKALCPQLL